MKFDEKILRFNIFEAMKYPSSFNSIYVISVINTIVQNVFKIDGRDKLEVILNKHLELDTTHDMELSDDLKLMVGVLSFLATTTIRYELAPIFMPKSHQKLLPSLVQVPIVELKSLSDHLKYAYLDNKETLPVIISAKLSPTQEDKLIRLLREYK